MQNKRLGEIREKMTKKKREKQEGEEEKDES